MLEIHGLQAHYGESQALHGASLRVEEGEIVTLLGRNGAGKTTTLKCVMGLIPDRKGSICFKGCELVALRPYEIARAGIALCPEERAIFSTLTVSENLLLPPTLAPGGLKNDKIFELFPNLKERLAAPGTKLSGGEQQMLAIARILRTGARLLLLDEPTEGLAPVIVQQIGKTILELKRLGFTVILVEQNFRFASKLADRHYIMETGRIVDEFTRTQAQTSIEKLQRYLSV